MPITVSHQERVSAERTVTEKNSSCPKASESPKINSFIVIYMDERTSEAINYQVELASRW